MCADNIRRLLKKYFSLKKIYVSLYGEHYQIIAVDQIFDGMDKVERHKMIYAPLIQDIINNKVHSISIYAFTPAEWEIQRQLYKI